MIKNEISKCSYGEQGEYNKKNSILLFMHIPKTGGTTLFDVLGRKYKKEQTLVLNTFRYKHELEEKVMNNSKYIENNIELIRGHFYYGIHEHINRKCIYFTLLRNPLERLVSLYQYLKNHELPEIAGVIREKNLSFDEYITSKQQYVKFNMQTKIIAGINEDRPINKNDYDLSINNIENNICFAGTIEMYDESLMLLFNKLRMSNPYYIKKNISNDNIVISKKTIEYIDENEKYDIMLHKHVQNKLLRELNINGKMHGKIARFKIVNKVYGQIMPTIFRVRKIFIRIVSLEYAFKILRRMRK